MYPGCFPKNQTTIQGLAWEKGWCYSGKSQRASPHGGACKPLEFGAGKTNEPGVDTRQSWAFTDEDGRRETQKLQPVEPANRGGEMPTLSPPNMTAGTDQPISPAEKANSSIIPGVEQALRASVLKDQ